MQGMIGEVRLFGGNFAPRQWAFCDGQLLAISQNEALFSILGTTYGGDGRTTFGLPELRGRTAIGQGQGPGLSNRPLGQKSGTYVNTMTINNLPSHSHTPTITALAKIPVSVNTPDENAPEDSHLTQQANEAYGDTDSGKSYGPGATFSGTLTVTNSGGQQSINNQQPYLGTRYIICLTGLFPSRH